MKRLLLLALLTVCAPAYAEDSLLSGTLKTIHDRGTILIDVRESSIPFSFLNKARQPIGFSVDLCHGIATDAAAALNVDLLEPDAPAWQKGVRIVYVPVAPDERLSKVISGAADGSLHALYNRWLTKRLPTGENLNLPISRQLAEMYRARGSPTERLIPRSVYSLVVPDCHETASVVIQGTASASRRA